MDPRKLSRDEITAMLMVHGWWPVRLIPGRAIALRSATRLVYWNRETGQVENMKVGTQTIDANWPQLWKSQLNAFFKVCHGP